MNVRPPKFREGDKVYYNGLGIKKRLTIKSIRWVDEMSIFGVSVPPFWEYSFEGISLASREVDISKTKF